MFVFLAMLGIVVPRINLDDDLASTGRKFIAVLRTLQDRLTQKQFLSSCSIPVPDFAEVQSVHQLHHAIKRLGLPLICKTARSGYDGKGQWLIRQPSEIAQFEQILSTPSSGGRWIAEQ